jgi:signal transduction histidine kinase
LGLAIVGDVMKVHGGSLQITSDAGHGVEVRIIFPL